MKKPQQEGKDEAGSRDGKCEKKGKDAPKGKGEKGKGEDGKGTRGLRGSVSHSRG